ncbi:MAG TPA: plastocyanin/azurin family copper-binding protein, partial [Armatimonadota bacterium]
DLAIDKLPLTPDGSAIDEESPLFTKLGSVEDVVPGAGGDMTIQLTPGRYIYFCNKPAHVKLGMVGEMNVVP